MDEPRGAVLQSVRQRVDFFVESTLRRLDGHGQRNRQWSVLFFRPSRIFLDGCLQTHTSRGTS